MLLIRVRLGASEFPADTCPGGVWVNGPAVQPGETRPMSNLEARVETGNAMNAGTRFRWMEIVDHGMMSNSSTPSADVLETSATTLTVDSVHIYMDVSGSMTDDESRSFQKKWEAAGGPAKLAAYEARKTKEFRKKSMMDVKTRVQVPDQKDPTKLVWTDKTVQMSFYDWERAYQESEAYRDQTRFLGREIDKARAVLDKSKPGELDAYNKQVREYNARVEERQSGRMAKSAADWQKEKDLWYQKEVAWEAANPIPYPDQAPLNQRLYNRAARMLEEKLITKVSSNKHTRFTTIYFFRDRIVKSPSSQNISNRENTLASLENIRTGGATGNTFQHYTPLRSALSWGARDVNNSSYGNNQLLLVITDGEGSKHLEQSVSNVQPGNMALGYGKRGSLELIGYAIPKEERRNLLSFRPEGWATSVYEASTMAEMGVLLEGIRKKYGI